MDSIADHFGRVGCAIVGGVIARCQTGQSVAVLGYGVVAIVAIVVILLIISRRGG
jgi:hypothetical protein